MPKSMIVDPANVRKPGRIEIASIPVNQYKADYKAELARFGAEGLVAIWTDMVRIREFETIFAKSDGVIFFGDNLSLGTLCASTFTSIITGQKPVSAFDDFVTNWKKLGGDKITAEVNDWYQTQK